MSKHPELYVESAIMRGNPFIMIYCQCGYQEWYEGRKFTILNLDEYNEKFYQHWANDCLKVKGESNV